jgi:hypothetical protein
VKIENAQKEDHSSRASKICLASIYLLSYVFLSLVIGAGLWSLIPDYFTANFLSCLFVGIFMFLLVLSAHPKAALRLQFRVLKELNDRQLIEISYSERDLAVKDASPS